MTTHTDLPSQILSRSVAPGTVAGWWTGGASWIFKHPTGAILYIDLFLREHGSPGWERRVPSPFNPRAMPSGSLLVTHEHGDHCDLTVLTELARRAETVILPPSGVTAYQREARLPSHWIIGQPGTVHRIGPWTISVWDSGDRTAQSARMYTVATENLGIFHGGDSLYDDPLFQRIGAEIAPTYALLSVGRPDPPHQFYLSPEQALAAATALRATRWIPMHWELWSQSAMDVHALERALQGAPPAAPWTIVDHGKPLIFTTDGSDPRREIQPKSEHLGFSDKGGYGAS